MELKVILRYFEDTAKYCKIIFDGIESFYIFICPFIKFSLDNP